MSTRAESERSKSLGSVDTGVDASRTSSDLEAAAAGLEELDVEVVDLKSRYEIVGTLGQGGMGEVLKAIDRRLARAVAIKRVRGDLAHHPQALARFLTEARAVATLNHFNIVQVYDYGRTVEGPFLVMEYVDGDSLEKRLKAGPLPCEEALDLAGQICDGLARAHSQGIIHRDIKPANILLASGGSFKLSDFGLARQQGADRGQTQTGAVLGTLDFMPPEQRVDASRADARSDLWSLAATLYQALTGKRPQLMKLGQLPVELQPLLEKALEEDPADRFQTAAEFRKALREVADCLRKPASGVAVKVGQCPKCEAVNDASRKFCLKCGSILRQPCPKCSAPVGAWEEFCGECGADISREIERLLSSSSSQREKAEDLRGEFRHTEALPIVEALAAYKHPALAPIRDWALALKPTLQEELQQLEANRESLLSEARQRFESHEDEQVLRLLGSIPQALRTPIVLELSQTASTRSAEVHRLLREIKAAVAARSFDGLLPKVQRLLELRPSDRSGIKLRDQLQQRENRLQQKHQPRVEHARSLLSKGDTAGAIGVLESIPTSALPEGGRVLLSQARGQTKHRPVTPNAPPLPESALSKSRGWSRNLVALTCAGLTVLAIVLWSAFRGEEPRATGGRESVSNNAATGKERSDNSLKMTFCWCPAGSFKMGDHEAGEKQVDVRLTEGFWLSKHELTQSGWEEVMKTRPWIGQDFLKEGADYPAAGMSRTEAKEFCKVLTEREQAAGLLPQGWEYRLPTEAQWEYACRAGSTTRFSFGNDEDELTHYAWYEFNTSFVGNRHTQKVGQKKANAWGLHDMHGNVFEWTLDNMNALPGGDDPLVLEGTHQVVRGGDAGISYNCRSARRYGLIPHPRSGTVGVRVALAKVNERSGDSANAAPVEPGPPSVDTSTPPAMAEVEAPKASDSLSDPTKGTKAGQMWDGNSLGMRFRWCPPGIFTMGSPEDQPGRGSDEGQISVTLTHGFWMGECEVTQGEWSQVVKTSLDAQRDKADTSYLLAGEGNRHPMYYVSHDEATDFAARLTDADRRAGKLPDGWEYRLPTEAQWEYACRAGTTTATAFGDTLASTQANFDGDYPYNGAAKGADAGQTKPVGSYAANAWGLRDMHGNVWEWCRDWYVEKLPGGKDPDVVSKTSGRLDRGGGWRLVGEFCRSARRGWVVPGDRNYDLGFRVAAVQIKPADQPVGGDAEGPTADPEAVAATETPRITKNGPWIGVNAGDERDDNKLNLTLCWCPPGSFLMGSPAGEPARQAIADSAQVPVTLTKGFWLSQTEITQQHWYDVMRTRPWFEHFSEGVGQDFPASFISWLDAKDFCTRLNDRERAAKRLPPGWNYTLPTEAQWEYACRAGSKSRFSFGDDESLLPKYGWSLLEGEEQNVPQRVGQKLPNAWGLKDMHGNCWEWCRDRYALKLPGGTDPLGRGQGSASYRGGGWQDDAHECRASRRKSLPPGSRRLGLGFRMAAVQVEQ